MSKRYDINVNLLRIADALEKLADEAHEQNELLRSCTLESEASPARLLVGVCGAIETVEL